MDIVFYKDTLYNTKDLLDEVMQNSFLEGVIISASMTKDGKVTVYNFASNTEAYIDDIQKRDLSELRSNSFVELKTFLDAFKDYKNKIIINLIGHPDIVDNPNKNEAFVKEVKKILDMYPNLKVYTCSIYDDIITFINKFITCKHVKKGMFVYRGNLNYYDVDFYVTPGEMFDTKVIAQQMKLNKEIFLIIKDIEEIIPIINKFKESDYLFSGMNKKEASKLLHVATKAPVAMNIVLNNKKN